MRPRVLVNMAMSLDGKINPAVRSGPFTMSRKKRDRARMLELRALADAVVIGAGNLRADDPALGLSAGERAKRAPPMRVVVTTRGVGLTGDEKVFDPSRGGPTVVAHADTMDAATRERLGARAELVSFGAAQVDVLELLAWLAARGCATVLCEGGGVLNAQFFAARAVDAYYLTLVPRVLGGTRAPIAVAGPGFGENEIPDAELVKSDVVDGELFLEYRFAW